MTLAIVAAYAVTPAIILWLCKRVPFLGKIGPVLLLYLIGIVLGNTGIIPHTAYKIQDLLVSIIIPLAIPLMLFSCNFLKWNIKKALLTLLTGITAVVIAIVSGYFIFGPAIASDPAMGGDINKIAGMLAGVYTGGTPNLAAIKIMLDVPNETYIMIHSYDMAISLLYLTFVLSFGIKLFRRILHNPPAGERGLQKESGDIAQSLEDPYKGFFKKGNLAPLSAAIAISVAIFAIAGGLSLILPKDMQMVVVILTITTLGIGASFIKRVREIKSSYDAGMYLVYIFCIIVASMADLGRMDIAGGLYLLLYIGYVIFGSLALQLIMAKIFGIDADTVLISSVSLINSPPFVPLIATAMNNKDVIITGLTVGLIGYAAGNYLGYLIAVLL